MVGRLLGLLGLLGLPGFVVTAGQINPLNPLFFNRQIVAGMTSGAVKG